MLFRIAVDGLITIRSEFLPDWKYLHPIANTIATQTEPCASWTKHRARRFFDLTSSTPLNPFLSALRSAALVAIDCNPHSCNSRDIIAQGVLCFEIPPFPEITRPPHSFVFDRRSGVSRRHGRPRRPFALTLSFVNFTRMIDTRQYICHDCLAMCYNPHTPFDPCFSFVLL